MKINIGKQELDYFVEDFNKNATIELVEGKEKTELEKVLEARGYQKKSLDLGMFKTIYAFTNKANSNGAILPEKQLVKVLPQIIGKPVNINHERSRVVGHYVDYKYIQKERKIIAYGVFYKSYYPEAWDKAKDLFKKKKLSTSFEIWSPTDARIYFQDGTYALGEMEIAGGALIYEDKEHLPAFKDAKALALAKEQDTKEVELVMAKYKPEHKLEEIITSENINQQAPTSNKVICSNCQKEVEINPLLPYNKCPSCKAILDRTGKILYPPQIKAWKLLCPKCKVDNWLILAQEETNGKIQCLQCQTVYDIEFQTKRDAEAVVLSQFAIYEGKINCLQCQKPLSFLNKAELKNRIVKCSYCGLEFPLNIFNKYGQKQIKNIRLNESNLTKSSKEGGQEMVIVAKFHRYIEDESALEQTEALFSNKVEGLEEAKILTYEEKQDLADSDFAVVVRVKDKKTGDMRKIRKYPIHDEAHVRNALARLGQDAPRKTLQDLGVSLDSVLKKVYRRAKALKLYSLLLRNEEELKRLGIPVPKVKASEDANRELIDAQKELIDKIEKAEAEIKTLKEELETTKAILAEKSNEIDVLTKSKIVAERRVELGETKLTDEEILDDKKFSLEKAQKAKVKKFTATDNFGGVEIEKGEDFYDKFRKGVDKKAFGHRKQE
ncbi:MAG: hypothetical protein JW924_03385 [Fusobacteriaceae bacterium]|nr:hypothetical protein [Fusobacteriaceae bacterium]